MPQDLFPDREPDDREPDGPGPAPEDDGKGMAQGLYVCLPAEHVTLAGFAQGGQADTMTPGPLLAAIVDTVTGQDGAGLAGCSDDQLVGIISAARRMQSRCAWTEMAAMTEFAARHAGGSPEDEFAADELASELHLTPLSAAEQMHYSSTVAQRLPRTFAALFAGRIHAVHVRIIEDETGVLGDQDAAKADQILAEAAPDKTFGELRSAAHKLVLRLDPEAVRKRKEAAKREAHVRSFREVSGNAGMVARELPSDEVLASWQHVEQRALDLRAAGMPGTLQELRVRAYLDLLQERDSRHLPAGSGAVEAVTAPDQPRPDNGPGGPAPAPAAGPSLAALVTITVPLATWQGRSETPGQADGFGLLDGDDVPRSGRGRGPPPADPMVRDRGEPRRDRRRARLPARPAPHARAVRPERHYDPGGPRPLRPRSRRDRLPPQPHPGPPDPGPQRAVHRTRLRPARGPLRRGPHPPLGPGRPYLRM